MVEPELTQRPIEPARPPTWWDTWYPRLLAVVQLGLGIFATLYEIVADVPNLAIFCGGILLVAGTPATVVAARILGKG